MATPNSTRLSNNRYGPAKQEHHHRNPVQYHQDLKQCRTIRELDTIFAGIQEHSGLPLVYSQNRLLLTVHPDFPRWCKPFVHNQERSRIGFQRWVTAIRLVLRFWVA